MKKENAMIRFWGKWMKAHHLDKPKIVETLGIFEEFSNNYSKKNQKNKKLLKRSFYQLVNSYFEDLEDFIKQKYKIKDENTKHEK